MTLEEYIAESERFEIPYLSVEEKIFNAQLGMVGEVGELVDLLKKVWHHEHPLNKEHVLKECGDILWYLTEYLRQTGMRPSKNVLEGEIICSNEFRTNLKTCVGGAFNFMCKPISAYNSQIADKFIWGIAGIASGFGYSLSDVMEANIAKLSARYPEGFTPEASMNRKEGDI